MNRSILWNGFEIKKGEIETVEGKVPYLLYSPNETDRPVNIALHGLGQQKEDWLCFNSVPKLGNLLKESIRANSPFIAFDLFGHGEWLTDKINFNIFTLTKDNRNLVISKTIGALNEAIPRLLNMEGLESNPISVTAYSLGCSVALGLRLDSELKISLIQPTIDDIKTNCRQFCLISGNNKVKFTDNPEDLYSTITTEKHSNRLNDDWIFTIKDFIYN